jgi:hypothetical protein
MTGEWPKDQIDHKNGNRSDNRFCNLREATRSQNLANSAKPCPNQSGLKGVCWNKALGYYVAQIRINGKNVGLGYFKSPMDAHLAYCRAAQEHYGDFARADFAHG